MHVSVTDAKAQLTDLVRRAEAGDDVVLTRHGRPTVRLVALQRPDTKRTPEEKKKLVAELLEIGRRGAAKMTPGPDAARSQNFLYGDDGLPE